MGRHERFLNKLLKIIDQHVPAFMGVRLPIDKNKKEFAEVYAKTLARVITLASNTATLPQNETLSLVFADHSSVKPHRLASYFDKIKVALGNVDSCTTSTPQNKPPLQVADILAYEIMRCGPILDPSKLRYTMRYLLYGGNKPHTCFIMPQPFKGWGPDFGPA